LRDGTVVDVVLVGLGAGYGLRCPPQQSSAREGEEKRVGSVETQKALN
jgi:hypothetical protein